MLVGRWLFSRSINSNQKPIREVMTHRIENRNYTLIELESGRFVWIVFEWEII